jgi:hypothetical protein
MTVGSDIAAIEDWLVEQGVLRPEFETLIGEYCQHLVAVGLPIWHAYFTSLTLHPTTATIGCLWHRESGVERKSYTHEDARLAVGRSIRSTSCSETGSASCGADS